MKTKEIQPVKLVKRSDDDGNKYQIPKDIVAEFDAYFSGGSSLTIGQFLNKFEKYMV